MSEAELKITHTTKHVKSKTDAFLYGVAEAMGKGLTYGLVIILVVWGINQIDVKSGTTSTEQH